MKRLVAHLGLLALMVSLRLQAAPLAEVTTQSMNDVLKIAKAISVVQPYLDDPKLLEYALGIYQAAKKYGIEPSVIIAITKQETSFREDLPEGAAGEIGITQIRKMWLKQKKFVREFGHRTIKDLKKPSKSFMFTAWLLKDLRKDVKKGSLPYWSFYNAVHFEPRLKYFMAVNKNIVALKKNEHVFSDRKVAVVAKAEEDVAPEEFDTAPTPVPPPVAPAITATKVFTTPLPVAAAKPSPDTIAAKIAAAIEPPAQAAPMPVAVATPSPEAEKVLVPKNRVAPTRVAEWQEKARAAQIAQSDVKPYQRLPTNGNRWIPDAMLKVRKSQQAMRAAAGELSSIED